MTNAGFVVGGGRLGNKYNNFSTLQALRWLMGSENFEERLVAPLADGRWFDGHRHPVGYAASAADAVTAHREILDRVRGSLMAADVVVITLGLVEVWRDREAGVWLNCTPPTEVKGYSSRYEFIRTAHAANLEALNATFGLLQSGKRRRIVCSVSPVPLFATFTDDDVLVANMYSKSTLRSVVSEAIADARSSLGAAIDYFPSYELAMLSSRDVVWRKKHLTGEPDGRHVRPAFVREVILPLFMDRYVGAAAIAG